MISIYLFCCKEKVFILMSTKLNGKSLMKQHYLKKEEFNNNLNMGDIIEVDYMNAEGFCKGFVKIFIWKVMHYFRLMFSKTSKKYV